MLVILLLFLLHLQLFGRHIYEIRSSIVEMISVIYIYVLGKTHTGYFKQLLLSHMTHLCQMGLKCFVKHCLGLFYEELLACVRPI